jgi:hypothetical protein
MRRYVFLGLLLAGLLGAGVIAYSHFDSRSDAGLVSMDQLPAGFLDRAKKELPQVKFDKAWKLKNGNYEIRGRDARGKAREVELDANGAVVEID